MIVADASVGLRGEQGFPPSARRSRSHLRHGPPPRIGTAIRAEGRAKGSNPVADFVTHPGARCLIRRLRCHGLRAVARESFDCVP
ncbi:hypothetical protein ABZ341_31565 [Streptomyces sp. NPDC006173]|uniref:hypothetical protein n=1 Tax=Streptomyces sp. NPDC006173 TaxID=3155349 RepID=UPI003401E533